MNVLKRLVLMVRTHTFLSELKQTVRENSFILDKLFIN